MSTDWIKMRVDLRTHPKVVRMSSALRADKLRVIGGLFAVWAIFDAHSGDGILEGYTFRAIDDELAWKGFAQAMANIDWLVDHGGEGLMAPRFDEHNGQSAKRRAMESERKRLEREADKQAQIDRTSSALDADKRPLQTVTREEKRREEEEHTSLRSVVAPKQRAAKKCPDSFVITLELFDWAGTEAPGVNVRRETEKFRDHTFKTAYSDWAGAWRNWIRRAAEGAAKSSGGSAESFRERDQRLAAEQMRAWAPGIAAGTDRDQHIIEMESANVFALQSN